MQNFLNIISILAFVMSAATWICTAYSHSINFSIDIKDYSKSGKCVQLYLMMQNNSSKPLAVSGLSIVTDKNKFPCEILSRNLICIDDVPIVKTPSLPVNFAAYQGLGLAFEFSQCSDIELAPGKTVVLEIYTNRKVLRRCVVLGNTDDVLHP